MSLPEVFALTIHADYRCRHAGACCSADWDVPVELPVYRSLSLAVQTGTLRPQAVAAHLDPFVVEPDLPENAAAMLERTARGECVFLEHGTRLCIIHRDLGEPALPSTCRHFPRLAVRDRRGTFITLSHFCPTAASMLFRDDRPLDIVSAPPAFPSADYEGLVVTGDDLPPLLSPAMLMDWGDYTAWERHMVRRCANADAGPESVLASLQRDVQLLRVWKPGATPLVDAIGELPRDYVNAPVLREIDHSLSILEETLTAVPEDLKPSRDGHLLDVAYAAHVRPVWRDFRGPLNRYLAAKAFASWTAYQGRGVATIVRGLDAALSLVRVEASR